MLQERRDDQKSLYVAVRVWGERIWEGTTTSKMNTNERSNEMNIPGFTAEASVYTTPGNYQMAGAPNDLTGHGVVPQMSFCRRAFNRCRIGMQIGAEGPMADTAFIWCNMYDVLC
jgi:hypothetical protein